VPADLPPRAGVAMNREVFVDHLHKAHRHQNHDFCVSDIMELVEPLFQELERLRAIRQAGEPPPLERPADIMRRIDAALHNNPPVTPAELDALRWQHAQAQMQEAPETHGFPPDRSLTSDGFAVSACGRFIRPELRVETDPSCKGCQFMATFWEPR